MTTPNVPPRPRRALRVAAAVLVSGGILGMLASQLDWARAGDALGRADPRWLLVSFGCSLAIVWMRGVRWTALQPDAGLGRNTAAICLQNFYNRIAPMRLGELALPHLLRRYAGLEATRTFLILVVVRIVELAVLLGLCAIATLARTGTRHLGWLIGIGGLLLAIVVLLAKLRSALRLAARLGAGVARVTRADRFAIVPRALAAVERALAGEAQLSGRQRASLLAWTAAIHLVQLASLDAIVRSFGVDLGWVASMQATTVGLLGPSLPLPSVGIVGALEASWVAGFVWVGVDLDLAIVTGVAAQVVTLGFAALFALPSWAYLRRGSSRRQVVLAGPAE